MIDRLTTQNPGLSGSLPCPTNSNTPQFDADTYCWTTWILFFFFHFSNSVCLLVYCLTRSSNTFFSPSEFVFSAGTTSLTVLSTRTPFIIRKHFLSAESGSRVSSTSLWVPKRWAYVPAVRFNLLKKDLDSCAIDKSQDGIFLDFGGKKSWDELMFFCFLFDVTNLLGDLL